MDTDTHYWLNRVAVKLYKLFLNGVDLGEASRWIFDWDEGLSPEENLKNVADEDKALTTLTTSGVINTKRMSNLYRDYQVQSPGIPVRWKTEWGNMDEPDPALREYDKVRFLEAFRYDAFNQFCKEQGINYKEDGIIATLEITDQIPIVRAGGKEYALKALQDGSPLQILEEAKAHRDERISFDKLRQWMGKPNAFKSQNNFKQIFRKNEFGEGNVLHPFVEIRTDTFILKEHVSLTPTELSAIQKASTD